MKCPPLDRLFQVPRLATIADLAEKYQELSRKKSKKDLLHTSHTHIILPNDAGKVLVVERNIIFFFFSFSGIQQFSFVVKEARNLIGVDISGTSDPYAILKVGETKYKSQVQKANCNPKWNEEFKL